MCTACADHSARHLTFHTSHQGEGERPSPWRHRAVSAGGPHGRIIWIKTQTRRLGRAETEQSEENKGRADWQVIACQHQNQTSAHITSSQVFSEPPRPSPLSWTVSSAYKWATLHSNDSSLETEPREKALTNCGERALFFPPPAASRCWEAINLLWACDKLWTPFPWDSVCHLNNLCQFLSRSWTVSTIHRGCAASWGWVLFGFSLWQTSLDSCAAVKHWSNKDKCKGTKPNLSYMVPGWSSGFMHRYRLTGHFIMCSSTI